MSEYARRDRIELGGQMLTNVHPREECEGPCPIHGPSDHHMRDWPLHWRDDRGLMERICPHGVGHPDPDQLLRDGAVGVHGCDGCCVPSEQGPERES